jgi:hypothetical protein
MVAVTLPQKVVEVLERTHPDLGWAIVTLVQKTRRARPPNSEPRDVQLVQVSSGQFLIVINPEFLHMLPGVQIVPLSATQAFLALDPGRGMSDLEVAVFDRLEQLKTPSRERRAVERLGTQLRKWRRDSHLQSHTRSIIIVTKRRLAR